jgi:hypothetical protein
MLSQPKQLDLTMKEGVYLMSYKQYNVVIRLFQLHYFYVEVYSFDEDGKIAMVNAFEDMKQLDPYLERLELPALFNN